MNDVILDSSVVAKWVLPEPDSADALDLISEVLGQGGRLVALDLAFPETANAIWKWHRQGHGSLADATQCLEALLHAPLRLEPALRFMNLAFQIGTSLDRAIYDALFVAAARELKLPGITADEPLFHVVSGTFPEIILLRDWRAGLKLP
jgi:predicted nucleic acid-binding protein